MAAQFLLHQHCVDLGQKLHGTRIQLGRLQILPIFLHSCSAQFGLVDILGCPVISQGIQTNSCFRFLPQSKQNHGLQQFAAGPKYQVLQFMFEVQEFFLRDLG